jgi:hypothetical protein
MMFFKNRLTAMMGSPEKLWRSHIMIAGAGGLFLGLHVVLFLAFPLTLPVLLGYGATGAALFVWITGAVYFQGLRNSMFYHGVLSIVGISSSCCILSVLGGTSPRNGLASASRS